MENETIMMMAFVLLVVGALTYKPYSLCSIKEKIRQDMWNPLSARRNNRGERIGDQWWLDCFNLLLDGSYGEDHYAKWLKRFNDAVFERPNLVKKDSTGWPYLPSKRLKSAVIEAFQEVMALHYGCTRGHFVKCLKAAVPADLMNEMTYLLMRAAIDHINEHVDDESVSFHVWISDYHQPRDAEIYEVGCN